MSNNVRIRPYQGGEEASLVALWNKCLVRDPITINAFLRKVVLDPNFDPVTAAGCYVAEDNGTPLGFIRSVVRTYPNDGLGLEEDRGWISVIYVDPAYRRRHIGTALLEKALDFLREKNRRIVIVCGLTGSAPGYVFPGVDIDTYVDAFHFFKAAGFEVDHYPVSMERDLLDFAVPDWAKELETKFNSAGIAIQPLNQTLVKALLAFLRENFPGDWGTEARDKLRRGSHLDEIIVAIDNDRVLGYCQYEGEHFGPFGVSKEMRGQGLGALLFCKAAAAIKAKGGKKLWFHWADEDAARFYERQGMRITRRYAIMTNFL